MTNAEFSDAFTTLLNSYNTSARFGDQASRNEIVLDEYEKSVLLTQAQDLIVKSYFDGSMNAQGQGFDDSNRRQMDFSSLIKVATLTSTTNQSSTFDKRGMIYQLPRKTINGVEVDNTTDVLFILNERLEHHTPAVWRKTGQSPVVGAYTQTAATSLGTYSSISQAEADGWVWTHEKDKTYVIVPISYKEYDREMSKPYAQPLKKQAWRLFQNQATGFDINTELIPRFNVPTYAGATFIYKIRYVKRPRPIILEDLPDDLEIDGETQESSCELNPIVHIDILNKAVDLAVATRGVKPQTVNQQQ